MNIRKAKTDRKDCVVIADVLRFGQTEANQNGKNKALGLVLLKKIRNFAPNKKKINNEK